MRPFVRSTALVAIACATLAAAPAARPRYGQWGLELQDMDRTVRPGDSFFDYAEGSWLKTAPIPADKAQTGYNYTLPDEAEAQVRAIVDDVAARPADATARQVGDYYAAWMDEAGIAARGLAPLRPWLAPIAAVKDRAALVALMMQPGYAAPFRVGINSDFDDPRHYALLIGQGRLGLPTRDYYLLPGEKYAAIRKAYRAYIAQVLGLVGEPDATASADAILALETRLAQGQWTPERSRDMTAIHNPMDLAALGRLAPQVDWPRALAAWGQPVDRVMVMQTTAVADAAGALDTVPLATWKAWLTFRFVSDNAAYLTRPIDDAHFAFYGHLLRDQPEQRARWKRGMEMLDEDLGEAVGRLYVARHWSPETDRLAHELVADIRAAYGEKIRAAAWMDEPTRAAALAKLASFDPRIGHPVRWIDYTPLRISRTDPLGNAIRAQAFRRRLDIARFPGPVDRGLWDMTPQTVNAYYSGTTNQVTLPAAILQPPFFDAAADPAVNYAETGATTIGHEMGHGFDDQGRKFDATGKLSDWWSASTAGKYKVKADRLAAQFDAYEPIPGVHIKGRLTLGENLADLGGLETAYAAYRRYVARHGEPPVIDGFTGDQRFFLAYAQAWQGKAREGALRQQLLSNPHSPDRYRVDGIVRNFDPWYRAFDVKPGDKLYLPPSDRVHVWG